MTVDEMLERIESFRDLEQGWDSYDASTINEYTIEFALELAPRLSHNEDWFVAPCSGGEILFESNKSIIRIYRHE